MSEPEFREATSAADYAAFAQLCREYVDWCRARYADLGWFVEEVFGHQSLESELEGLAGKYGPPRGRAWLAEIDGSPVAAGAYRRIDPQSCELKRLYVSDRARGHGVGRRLTQALVEAARAEGFETMLLDTADRLHEAIALYRSLGFEDVAPFHDYPPRLAARIVFMARGL